MCNYVYECYWGAAREEPIYVLIAEECFCSIWNTKLIRKLDFEILEFEKTRNFSFEFGYFNLLVFFIQLLLKNCDCTKSI